MVVVLGTNDGRFIILGENERSDRNCGDLVGKDREQMFNLSTVSSPCIASICLLHRPPCQLPNVLRFKYISILC